MKTKILLSVSIALSIMLTDAQNLMVYGDFEFFPASFTVADNSVATDKALMAIDQFSMATVRTSNPVAPSGTTVNLNQWYKKAPNSSQIKANLVVEESNNCINLFCKAGNTSPDTDQWNIVTFAEKINTLENDKKYKLTFSAKKDATSTNVLKKINAFIVPPITAAQKNLGYYFDFDLIQDNDWHNYEAVFDLPVFLDFLPTGTTIDYTLGAFVGVSISVVQDSETGKSEYCGALFDNFVLKEYSEDGTTNAAFPKNTETIIHAKESKIIFENITGQIEIYDISGKLVISKFIDKEQATVPFNASKGIYIVKTQNLTKKIVL